MREILFSGKKVHNGEWVYGYYVFRPDGKHLIYYKPFEEASQNTYHEVIPQTVGQFTGLTDKNGKKAFDGHIAKILIPAGGFWGSVSFEQIGVIKWSDDRCRFIIEWEWSKNQHHVDLDCDTDFEVIGSVHDNLELLQ